MRFLMLSGSHRDRCAHELVGLGGRGERLVRQVRQVRQDPSLGAHRSTSRWGFGNTHIRCFPQGCASSPSSCAARSSERTLTPRVAAAASTSRRRRGPPARNSRRNRAATSLVTPAGPFLLGARSSSASMSMWVVSHEMRGGSPSLSSIRKPIGAFWESGRRLHFWHTTTRS